MYPFYYEAVGRIVYLYHRRSTNSFTVRVYTAKSIPIVSLVVMMSLNFQKNQVLKGSPDTWYAQDRL